MKAFLSHSSKDKELVKAVAKELGRQFCIFDEQAFTSGEEFKTSIERSLDESSVFVLFASRHAKESIWVEFEVEEAWYRKLRNTLPKALAFLIDSSLERNTLPEWLKRSKIWSGNTPKVIARDIKLHLDELIRERQHPHYIGRSADLNRLEEALTPADSSLPPHAIFIVGLPGIGRRSLIKRSSPMVLNLRKYVQIELGEGDSINDICIRVADQIEPYSTKEGFSAIIEEIRSLSEKEALVRTLENLRAMVRAGELPILIDDGGLLDSEGVLREPIQMLLGRLEPNDDAYIFFVSTRKPQQPFESPSPTIRVNPLSKTDTMRLIALVANRANLTISHKDVEEIAEYVAGYPPAVYFAIKQAADYGVPVLISYKTRLVEFRTSVFIRHISKHQLSETEKALLQLLSPYSPLPLPVIAKVLSIDERSIDPVLMRLIDLSLIVTTEDGFYEIAKPVADAVMKTFGFSTEEQSMKLAAYLSKFLEDTEIEISRLALSRVVFRAALWSKDEKAATKAIHLSNDLIKLTEALYHQRRYEEAIHFGYGAIKERPESITARSYLIRALIQEEKWQEAKIELQEYPQVASLKDVYFLNGFFERKRHKISAAIDLYEKSENAGRAGAAIKRELAYCYFINREIEKASKYINDALKYHGDNPYVVDLWAQIATVQKDSDALKDALARLEIIDESRYLFRLSRVRFAFEKYQEAYEAAQKAVALVERPPFEVLAQRAYCEIELHKYNEAEESLNLIDQRFRSIRNDIRLALRCRLAIAQGHYGETIEKSKRFIDKNTFHYKKIMRDALAGELSVSALEDKTRIAYKKELVRLEVELADTYIEEIYPISNDL